MERQMYEEEMKIYFERQRWLHEERVRLIRQQRSQVLNHHTGEATRIDADGSRSTANGEDKDVGELA